MTNPNWRLTPRPEVKVSSKDPLFESTEELPYISSSVNSHLVSRAVNLNDLTMLKKWLADSKICDVNPRRSLATSETPMDAALTRGNLKGKNHTSALECPAGPS